MERRDDEAPAGEADKAAEIERRGEHVRAAVSGDQLGTVVRQRLVEFDVELDVAAARVKCGFAAGGGNALCYSVGDAVEDLGMGLVGMKCQGGRRDELS